MAVNAATSGEVLELSESCAASVVVTNKQPFTLEGDGSTVLTPKTAATSIIESSTEGVQFTLEDLTFKDGSAEVGAAVSVESEKEAVTLRDDTFLDGVATNDGGAVFLEDLGHGASEPTVIEGDTFGATGEGNTAKGFAGGAVYVRVSGPLRVTGDTFTDNAVTSNFGGGGGLDVESSGTESAAPVTISGNTFTANRVLDSGGGAFIMAAGHQTVILEHNLFSANRVTGEKAAVPREGGGLVVHPLQFVTPAVPFQVLQAHNTFSGNVVEATEESGRHEELPAGGGGEWVLGVDVKSTADVFEDNSVTVNEGQPPEGGGLGVLGTSTGEEHPQLASFTGIDDDFLDNWVAAGGWGGGIYTGYQDASCSRTEKCAATTLVLDDSTVFANEVKPGAGSQGGALWGSPNDSLTVANSIIFGNSPQPEVWGYATGEGAPTFKYSDVCAESGGSLVPTGEGDVCANPLLDSEGAESATSPTIDAGSTALVPEGLTTDVLGNPRILQGPPTCTGPGSATVDMGAFELQVLYSQALPPSCATGAAPSTVPQLTSLRESATRWREGNALATISKKRKTTKLPVGTTFSFSLNVPASVTLTFTTPVSGRRVGEKCVAQTRKNRKRHRCSRTVPKGTLTLSARQGTNSVRFEGLISKHKKLKPGRYTLAITATDTTGGHSASERISFTVVKQRSAGPA